MDDAIKVGMKIEAKQPVTPERAAAHIGSGSLQVYATPAMVTFVEHTCRQLIEPHLPAGQTTVGTRIELEHLAPTPIGGTIHIEARVIEIEGRRIECSAEIRDEQELVGRARHERFIIDEKRFLERVEGKASRSR
jgi:fluoroacetyl-CoA thioesterase